MKEFVYKPNPVWACQYLMWNQKEVQDFFKEIFEDEDAQIVQLGNSMIVELSGFKRIEIKYEQWVIVMKDLSYITVLSDDEFSNLFEISMDAEPVAGNKYLCIKDVVSKTGDVFYIKGIVYCFTNDDLDHIHRWDNKNDGNGYTFQNTFQLLGNKNEIIGVASGPDTTDNVEVDQNTPPS